MLPSGRALGYATYGSPPSPSTPTVLYFHGFPGSRLEAALFATVNFPVHIISIDRPGMGLSTFQPGRRILDWPLDVLALVDHLKIAEFHVVADSGGSPFALVCAKDLPRTRLKSTAVVSGIYPVMLGTQGMLWGVWLTLVAGTWLPTAVMTKLLDWEFGDAIKNENRETLEEKFLKAMESKPESDRRCLDDLPFREVVIDSMREAFRQGSEGPAWECGLFGQWGFDLEEVDATNVSLWHGKKDVNAPFAMAEKASKLIKGCELHAFEDESHLSLPYRHIEEIMRGILKV